MNPRKGLVASSMYDLEPSQVACMQVQHWQSSHVQEYYLIAPKNGRTGPFRATQFQQLGLYVIRCYECKEL